MKLRSLVPNFYIHVSVTNLYIPRIGPWQIEWWEYIYHCGNWEIEHYNCFGNHEAAPFHIWKFINRNKTFVLDSHPALHLRCRVLQLLLSIGSWNACVTKRSITLRCIPKQNTELNSAVFV
jgi:hypothetical protein